MALNILGDLVDGNDIGTSVSNCLIIGVFSLHPPGGDRLLLSMFLSDLAESCLFDVSACSALLTMILRDLSSLGSTTKQI